MANVAVELAVEPRARALGALKGMVQILAGETELPDQFRRLNELVGEIIDSDSVAFQLHKPGGGWVAVEAVLREPAPSLHHPSSGTGNVLLGRFAPPADSLVVPWEAAGRALGQIRALGSRQGRGFDSDDELILNIAGELAGAALIRRLPAVPNRQPFALSRREEVVAALIARGYTNGRIAQELTIARTTVATHVAHILAKLHFRSRAQVAAWVARELTERRFD